MQRSKVSDDDIRIEISESVYYCNSCAAPNMTAGRLSWGLLQTNYTF